jgi:hypothetical protein
VYNNGWVSCEDQQPVRIQPILQAIVLADQIYVDERTNKKVIAGTFNQLSARLPTTFNRPAFVFLCLTAVRGKLPLVIRFVDLSNGQVLLETDEIIISQESPLQSAEVVSEMHGLPLPHEGAFAFEVYSGTEQLGSLRVLVKEIAEAAS